jgi:serine/threonine protein kinase
MDAHAIAPGAVIGPYTLIRFVSEGGMGEVWQAERRDTFRQRVALKFMTTSSASPREALARFEQEREVLAALEHPNIAKIFDGGLHHGRPWFAMEYVDGEPITEFCDRGPGRDLTERLALFRQVCDAVTHAHRRGIIHRDLKPSNILVGMGTGDTPVVKVIDFGIAKAMSGRLTDRTSITLEHRPIGTFEYMSPEQADPGGRDIDTRTDVYSLGVVLYELLAGVKPFDLQRRAEEEARRIVIEEDAPTPSTRLSTVATRDSGTAQRISRGRREQIQALIGRLRNELEWIPLMAIRKDRERRYASPEDLARDIENYVQGRPLVAAPESPWYRARKFGRRHRRALSAAAVTLAALVATTTAVSLALVERTRALALAQEREAELMGVLDFQTKALSRPQASEAAGQAVIKEILEQADRRMRDAGTADADRTRRVQALRDELRSINAAEVLRRSTHEGVIVPAIRSIEASSGVRDQLRSLLLMSLGQSQWALGFEPEARAWFVEARRINERLYGIDGDRTLWSRLWVASSDPDPVAGRAEAEAVEAERLARFGAGSPQRLEALRLRRDLDALLPGGREPAIALARELHALSRAGDPASREAIDDAIALGEMLRADGSPEEARQVLSGAAASLAGPSAPRDLRARALLSLGAVLARSTKDDEVERGIALLREANALAAEAWGIGHPLAFQARGDLAACLVLAEGDDPASMKEAVRLIDESIEIDRRMGLGLKTLPGDQSNLATILAVAALEQSDAAALSGARAAAVRSLEAARDRLGPTSDQTLQIARATAVTMALAGGDLREAERLLRETIGARARGGESPGTVEMLTLAFELARNLRAQQRTADAVAVMDAAERSATGERPTDSESRWLVSTLLLSLLEESEADAGRIEAQRAEVATLRAAAVANQRHACEDWRNLPWPK